MKNAFSLPVGIKEYTTTNVNKIEFLCSTILEESELWGYKKIITPIFETLDSLNVGLRQESLDKTIKFIEAPKLNNLTAALTLFENLGTK